MDLKAEWLNTRKQQIISELTQCELQSQQIIQQLTKDNANQAKQLNNAQQANKQSQNRFKQQIGKYSIQIKTFQNLILSKQEAIQSLKSQNSELLAVNQQRSVNIQQSYSRILQIDHLLAVQKEESQKMKNYYEKILAQRETQYIEERQRIKRQYEEQIQQKQKKLSEKHQQQLSQMKRNNIQLLQKIQSQYQNISSKSTQNNKQIQLDCSRLVSENTKLLSTVNEYKLKILTLQSTSNSHQQQIKLLQKQIEIIKQNNRRQNTFLKEEKVSLSDKNKKLMEKVQQLSWSNRQNQLKKDEDIKKIKKEVDKSFQQILINAQQENKKRQTLINSLQKQIQVKNQELQQMQQISLRIKQLYQTQQQQMIKLKQEREHLKKQAKNNKQTNLIKINQQLKSEIIRKNCQIQVLQDQVKRLKSKINTAATAQQQYIKHKQVIQKQNKMLLSEIIFLREKQKKGRNKMQDSKLSKSNFLIQMNSQQSKDYEDVEEYKKIIQFMTQQMNEVSKMIIEKDNKIKKLEQLVKRYELQLKDSK